MIISLKSKGKLVVITAALAKGLLCFNNVPPPRPELIKLESVCNASLAFDAFDFKLIAC